MSTPGNKCKLSSSPSLACVRCHMPRAGFHEDVLLAIPSTTQVCLRFPQFVAGP